MPHQELKRLLVVVAGLVLCGLLSDADRLRVGGASARALACESQPACP